ncbi:MAG: Rieske (2Fe-2S) protein [Candidatus Omnitrophica bacterium]|nr:Rieske (2Fe-2S) protein [Candidatus Omnitrophota bacterium]
MAGEELEFICKADEVKERASVKFAFRQGELEIEGFLIRMDGKFYAYVNECAHLPMSMDWGDNDFFTQDGGRLMCKTHGAVYVPETGLCVDGPCPGRSLVPIPIEVKDGSIWRIKRRIPRDI